MKDIELAKALLEKEQLSVAIVKDGKTLFVSRDKGIKPLFTAVYDTKLQLKGASVADKVIGQAAARLCVSAGINGLFAKLLSENAVSILNNTGMVYEWEKLVPSI